MTGEMTGEMSKEEVTRDAYPMYFAAADLIPNATVEPFDQYQGPYIHVPGRGQFFLISEDGHWGRWYSVKADTVSSEFLYNDGSTEMFQELIKTGGTPVDRTEKC